MKKTLNSMLMDQEGQGLVEYSLIVSLIIIVAIEAIRLFGGSLSIFYQNNIVDKLP